MSASAAGRVYDLGGEPVTLRELAERLVRVAGRGEDRFVPFQPDRKVIDIVEYYGHARAILKDLGWEPRIPLDQGLAATVQFYRAHHEHYWEPGR